MCAATSCAPRYRTAANKRCPAPCIASNAPDGWHTYRVGRVREVLRALWPHCTSAGLAEALKAQRSVPTAQRLGALLTLDGQHKLAKRLSRWLKNQTMRRIALEGTLPPVAARTPYIDADFKVWIPPQREANA